jgi:ATP-binding protein involved in chromosome partitioning
MKNNVKHVIAVASGQGGVGKSTLSVNLALALQRMGARTGIADTDIVTPSILTMLGAKHADGTVVAGKIIPALRHEVKLVSLATMTGDDVPGPLVSKCIQLFIGEVAWGELDYLILDLPPGTGEAQLTIAESTPRSGAIIVTTPQDVSLNAARRALRMFEKAKTPILGVIENMSSFVCPHCGASTDILRRGGGQRISEEFGVPFLGSVPIDSDIVTAGDDGLPVVVAKPNSHAALAYSAIAVQLARCLAAAPGPTFEPIRAEMTFV